MAETANQFLDKLQAQGLINDKIIDSLRRQVADSKKAVSAQAVAKLLVNKGQLTAFQAKRILGDVADAGAGPDPATAASSAPAEVADAEVADDEVADDDVVALKPVSKQPAKSAGAAAAPQPQELVPLSDDNAQIVEDSGGLTPLTKDDAEVIDAAELTPLSEAHIDVLSAGAGLESLDGFADMGPHGGPLPGGGVAAGGYGPGGVLTAPAQPAAKPGAGFKGKRVRSVGWYWWAGPIVILTLGGFAVGLYLWLGKEKAEVMWEKADKAYKNENYPDAVDKYDKFLAAYPEDDNAALARVKVDLARIRIPVKTKRWDKSLEAIKTIVPKMEENEREHKFSVAREELASILPQIAEGFVQQAEKAEETKAKKERLALAGEIVKDWIGNPSIIPTSIREIPVNSRRFELLDKWIEDVRRDIDREERLVATIAEIERLVADNKTVAAFEARKQLMEAYPELIADERLRETVVKISEKEQELVQAVSQEMAAETTERDSPVLARIALTSGTGQPIAALQDQITALLVEGAVYAVNAGSGQVLWSRYVGRDVRVPPQRVSGEPRADVILIEAAGHQLVRVKADNGQLVWRLPIGEPFAAPLVMPDAIFVSAQSGRLFRVNAETGESNLHAKFTQPLGAGAGPNLTGSYLYQTGDHSNLYVVSASQLDCREVRYLGHKSGSVKVPPLLAQGHLFIAENAGSNYSLLHVLRAGNRQGTNLSPAQDPIRMTGHVIVPLMLYGKRILVVTDRGEVHIFEVDPEEGKRKAVYDVARYPTTSDKPMTTYPASGQGRLWLADKAFSVFNIQTARGELKRGLVVNQGDTFVAPLIAYGNTVIHARRHRRTGGVSVEAVNGQDGKPIWRTDLAVKLAGPPIVNESGDSDNLAVTAQAELFALSEDVRKAGVARSSIDASVGKTELDVAFARRIELGDGRYAFAGPVGDRRILLYDGKRAKPLSIARLERSSGAMTAAPVPFQGGLLVPVDRGQVLLVDPNSARDQVRPFQPRLEAGAKVAWRRPAVINGGKEFVVADNQGRLHRVAINKDPQPHLAKTAAAMELEGDVVSPLAATDDAIYLVMRNGRTDSLLTFSLPDMKLVERAALDGRVAWGPQRVGDVVFVATDSEGLFCLEDRGKARWILQLNDQDRLAGPPAPLDGDFIIATVRGKVLRVGGNDGKPIGDPLDAGEPFGTGPVISGQNVLVGASDGAVIVLPVPAGS